LSFIENKDLGNRFIPNFIINTQLFSEAQNNNVYFNRKIYINENGEIKNSIETNEADRDSVFKNQNFSITANSKISKLWNINKDVIDICKDCEFRYMCVDNRIPLKKDDDTSFYFEHECAYNPYISKWYGEENYISLNETGVKSNKEEFLIDHGRINELNSIIWENY